MPSQDFVIVVAFTKDGQRFLVVRHRERGWELPGGRVRVGEDPPEGARREFEEETGHRLEDVRLVHVRRRGAATGYTFSGQVGEPSGRPRTEKEPVTETRLVRRLGEVSPLAFPDDPYAEIGRALGRSIL